VQRKNPILIIGAIFVLAACAASEPKEPPASTIERVVSTDVDATWNALVAGIKGRDFEINSLAKESRTIRVLVRSAAPSQYVDCGEISVRSKSSEFGDRNYDFPAANSARYLVADDRVDELVDVERRTSLNALATVHLTPSGQGTRVSVAADYVMNFRTREFGNNVNTRSLDDSLNFASLGRASLNEQIRVGAKTKTVKVECKPTGELERRLVAALG
jgi:hypothetical protein